MWIEIFEKTERDAQELLTRLEFMYLNIKSHKEKGTPYDQKIIKYLNAWGLDKQDSPDIYLSNTNKIWEKVTLSITKMREHLGQKEPDPSIGALSALGNLIRYLEEVMSLWWPGSENPETKNDYLFEFVDLLRQNSNKLGELISQIDDLDKIDKSLISELNTRNPWSKYAKKP